MEKNTPSRPPVQQAAGDYLYATADHNLRVARIFDTEKPGQSSRAMSVNVVQSGFFDLQRMALGTLHFRQGDLQHAVAEDGAGFGVIHLRGQCIKLNRH